MSGGLPASTLRSRRRNVSKPCARAGCVHDVWAPGPATLLTRRFCSHRCSMRGRLEAGWRPKGPTREQRQAGGRKGGVASGNTRRKKAIRQAVARVERFLTPDIVDALTFRQVARVKLVLARAWKAGYKDGLWGRWSRLSTNRAKEDQPMTCAASVAVASPLPRRSRS